MVEVPLPDPTAVAEKVVDGVLRRPFAEVVCLVTIGCGFAILAAVGYLAVATYREQAVQTRAAITDQADKAVEAIADQADKSREGLAEAREHFGRMHDEQITMQRALLQHLGLKLSTTTTASTSLGSN